MRDLSHLDPFSRLHGRTQLARPGNWGIQLDPSHDYGTNVTLYPWFQEYVWSYQPPTLIVWGRHDFIFPPDGAYPYLEGLPKAEFQLRGIACLSTRPASTCPALPRASSPLA
ncbi:alpha/beta fold hydrolase [Streptomyces sp. NPDC059224]|uniref:alpha/beta fold hydrolase n=1 Tax=Streptomyces sp. NPDC059224 TaxID=3346775 RepID=UPI0036D13B27